MNKMEVREQLEEKENKVDEINEVPNIQLPPFPIYEDLAKIAESHRISITTTIEIANKQTYVMYMELEQAFGAKSAKTISKFCQRKKGGFMGLVLPKGVYPALYLSYPQFNKIIHVRGILKNDSRYLKLKKAHEVELSNPIITVWNNLKNSDIIAGTEYLKTLIDGVADNPAALSNIISNLNILVTLEVNQLLTKKKEIEEKIASLSQELSTTKEQIQKIQWLLNVLPGSQGKTKNQTDNNGKGVKTVNTGTYLCEEQS